MKSNQPRSMSTLTAFLSENSRMVFLSFTKLLYWVFCLEAHPLKLKRTLETNYFSTPRPFKFVFSQSPFSSFTIDW